MLMEPRRVTVCRECLARVRVQPNNGTGCVRRQHWATRTSCIPASSPPLHVTSTITPILLLRQTRRPPSRVLPRRLHTTTTSSSSPTTLAAVHTRILDLAATILHPSPDDSPVPSEQRILFVLDQLGALHRHLLDAKTANALRARVEAPHASPHQKEQHNDNDRHETTATSALLGSVNARQHPVYLTKISLLLLISDKAEEILRHDAVFITPAVLKAYVELQASLHQPASFADIFHLYAHKPVPKLSPGRGKTHLDFTPAQPTNTSSAIAPETAHTALASAISTHHLPLCLDIISTTFATPSFQRARTIRLALVPLTGLVLSPLAAYTLSTSFGTWQTTMDPTAATGVAFAGIMTYVLAVGGMGYVAITTANDQMDRVSWAQGVGLWERWTREEERRAVDRVAGKWGFAQREKRGEEEGEEWEMLREFAGRRGMVLDSTRLMEGME